MVIATLSNISSDGMRAVPLYDLLVAQNPVSGEIENQIAESLTSTDGSTWVLKIRPNVKFSDGTPYDAAAVKFNWERHQNPDNKSLLLAAVQNIESLTASDAQTLTVKLKSPNGQFPRVVARYLGAIASPTALQAPGADFTTKPVGAGPFLLKEWVRDDHITFVRNPTYWNAPRPYVDELVLKIIIDDDLRYKTLVSGGAQWMYESVPLNIDSAERDGYTVLPSRLNGGYAFVFNMQKPPFNDVRARKIVQIGMDRERYTEVVDRGVGDPMDNVFREGSPFHDPALDIPKFDPKEAQRLIDEYVAATGGPLEFSIMTATLLKPQAEFFQAQFAQYDGVKINVDETNPTTYGSRRLSGDYQAIANVTIPLDPEPDLWDGMHTSGIRNFGKYSDPAVDEALETGRASLDEMTRIGAYKTVLKALNDDAPRAFFTRYQLFHIYNDEVAGVETFEDIVPWFDRVWLRE
jgi:peptide/nickel transport system substrate-binding protein